MPIVNPGSLSLGEYGTMKLMLNAEGEHKHWYVSETTKKYIPSFIYHEAGEEEYFDEEDTWDEYSEEEYLDEEEELNSGKNVIKEEKMRMGATGGKVRHYTHGVNPHVMSSLLNKAVDDIN